MNHWQASSLAGVVLTGRYKPLCATVHGLPDSRFRRAFIAAMDRWFEPGHCQRVADTYAIGAAVRDVARAQGVPAAHGSRFPRDKPLPQDRPDLPGGAAAERVSAP